MESFSIPTANKIFHVSVLLLIYYYDQFWHQKFVRADVIAVFVNKQQLQQLLVFSDEDKILIKSLYLKRYTAKTLTDEFPE